jgi:hypothetical protein
VSKFSTLEEDGQFLNIIMAYYEGDLFAKLAQSVDYNEYQNYK